MFCYNQINIKPETRITKTSDLLTQLDLTHYNESLKVGHLCVWQPIRENITALLLLNAIFPLSVYIFT